MYKIIHITHFKNPHCFYFKFDDDLHDHELQELEEKISKFARSEIQNKSEEPNVSAGDYVAAFEVSWGKWVRAIVRCTLEQSDCFELWAIDHGKVFRTPYRLVVPLPQALIQEKVKGAYRGSLYGVLPAKMDSYKPELTITDYWSDKAIEQCKTLIGDEKLAEVHFELKDEREDCFFGILYLQNSAKKSTNFRRFSIMDPLLRLNFAIQTDFDTEIDQIMLKYANECIKSTCNGSVVTSQVRSNVSSVAVAQQLSNVSRRENRRYAPSAIQSTVIQSEIDGGATRMPSAVQSTIVPSEIDGGNTRMHKNTGPHMKPPSVVPSAIQSTVIASEIDGGNTRMHQKTGPHMNPPSAAPSAVGSGGVPSEIDGGATRMQMHTRKTSQNTRRYTNNNQKRNVRPHMPAGFEPDMNNFHRYNSNNQ